MKKRKFVEEFDEKYLSDIKKEFELFGKFGAWRFSSVYDGESIYPLMIVESEEFKYQGDKVMTAENSVITDPFKIIIVSPEDFYNQLKNQLKIFIKGFKESLDKKVRDSFMVEIRKGRIIKSNEFYTLDMI